MLPRAQGLELFLCHAGTRQHALALHCLGRAERNGHVGTALGAGLEQKRDLQHRELGSLLFLCAQEIDLGLDHHGMHDGLQLLQAFGFTRHLLGEQRAVDSALAHGPGKSRRDRRHRRAFIELMHVSVGVEHGDAAGPEMRGRRALAHAHAAGEPDDQHQPPSRLATTWALSAGVTSGRTPNQRSKPGTA